MPRKKRTESEDPSVLDYRYDSKRKNIPPAGMAAQEQVREVAKMIFAYNPHLPPLLRFDARGKADRLPELLEKARQAPLTSEEADILAAALKLHEPWLEWAGKREAQACEVDPIALHIHERLSAQAILKVAAREPVQRNLFADPEMEYHEAVQFYQHDMEWANRLILGDSLAVMASLSRRENLAGKVQMIYIDPPYGIKFASNFQSQIGKRDVKDREVDLTREPEMVKAYRDTWTLGVHSYLAYLRDRLYAAKELLADTGSIFIQISDENVHRVRQVMDDVFGAENFIVQIVFRKTSRLGANTLTAAYDYALWYARDLHKLKYRPLFTARMIREDEEKFTGVEFLDGSWRRLTEDEKAQPQLVLDAGGRLFRSNQALGSQGFQESTHYEFEVDGTTFVPGDDRHWSHVKEGMNRLKSVGRVVPSGKTLQYKQYFDDFDRVPMNNVWSDVMAALDKGYVVETHPKVITRCLLMTTDPGDLVLDPTCGGGTTAFVAEQWGRRWITIDTSRVAIAIARQRLLTAKFDYYQLRSTSAEDLDRNPRGAWLADPQGQLTGACTLDCKTVPRITPKSIAQNVALDPIFAKWEPVLADKLAALNRALSETVTPDIRQIMRRKLLEKEKAEGKRAVTDADRRRWELPESAWREWEVPFDTDPEWPEPLQTALTAYRQTWRQKMDEVNACINARADNEELVDQPKIARNLLRVSGPFTVEGVMPAEESIDFDSPIDGAPDELETFDEAGDDPRVDAPTNAESYLDQMTRLLRGDGVRFPNNRMARFSRLERASGGLLHAEGEWTAEDGAEQRVAVAFGPQYGPVTAKMVEECLRQAYRLGYDALVFAGFSFDGAAQAAIQADPNPRVRVHMAHIRPDVNMGDLLKNSPNSQLFTVSGTPRTRLEEQPDGQYRVIMDGVDIYDPVDNTVRSTGADKVAAWFLDADYDGNTFCVTQAFFPDPAAWDKLAKALKDVVDPERFAALSSTASLPFSSGKHQRIAVKVIDPRGNEVMRVHALAPEVTYA